MLIGDHLNTCTPIQPAEFHVMLGTFNRHRITLDMPHAMHLIGDHRGLPSKLPRQTHMHQVRSPDAAALRQWSCQPPDRFDTIRAGFKHLHHFTGPEPVITIMRLIKFDAHQLPRKRKPDEHHTAIDMADTATLIGIPFDTHFYLHTIRHFPACQQPGG